MRTMKYRLLGSSGRRVSELFLGAMTFGEQGGVGAPLEESPRMLDAYAELGGNVIAPPSTTAAGRVKPRSASC
jgi:aryl-alcohol dehydrogenase-like predicted oxidoreductase